MREIVPQQMNDSRQLTLTCTFVGPTGRKASGHGTGYASKNWKQLCADHESEFPEIYQCHPGTFNVRLEGHYTPPEQERYKRMARDRGAKQSKPWYVDGNHISPRSKVIRVNNLDLEAWIYCGGHQSKPVLELISKVSISEKLSLHDGDKVTLVIQELPEGSNGMPLAPPSAPGRILD